MKTSEDGINEIKEDEGLKLRAYQCSAGKWTYGYGHTKNVKQGDVITYAQANNLLRTDIAEFEIAVDRLVQVPLTQNQYDALMSFTYNLGAGSLAKSTLLKKLNASDYNGAAQEFSKWIYATSKKTGKRIKLEGLIARRKREAELFFIPDKGVAYKVMKKHDGTTSTYMKDAPLIQPDPNNKPIPHETLPLPTLQQEGLEPIVKPTVSKIETVKIATGAGVGVASIGGAIEYAPNILSALQGLDWRVAMAVVVLGLIMFLWIRGKK